MTKRRTSRQLWGGFVDGRLNTIAVDTGWGGFGYSPLRPMPAIFTSRKVAREQYEDVRKIEVRQPGER